MVRLGVSREYWAIGEDMEGRNTPDAFFARRPVKETTGQSATAFFKRGSGCLGMTDLGGPGAPGSRGTPYNQSARKGQGRHRSQVTGHKWERRARRGSDNTPPDKPGVAHPDAPARSTTESRGSGETKWGQVHPPKADGPVPTHAGHVALVAPIYRGGLKETTHPRTSRRWHMPIARDSVSCASGRSARRSQGARRGRERTAPRDWQAVPSRFRAGRESWD